MTAPPLTTVDDAEAAYLKAVLAPTTEPLRALLHPQFVAIHSPVGLIHDKEQFLADSAKRPTPEDLRILTATIRHYPDTATVSCLQEMRIPFVPDTPAFAIQQAVSRVWVHAGEGWQLAHLQMGRRLPPA
ncbi:nuclear transport factor 2 family protein [Streptomyces sp. NPDC127079]|uniref:nuclear transport factor 2 family protein n=1 Tax=Streptomyces sp. NPDC127079 TaxID=3347132 RepID=UPI003658D9CD